jgi:hypothetical protein
VNPNDSTLQLLEKLKTQMPEIWNQAEVVGHWVWLEFNVAPEKHVRGKLRELGFHWNHVRQCWQHPCGAHTPHSRHDPKEKYPVIPATALELNEAPLAHAPVPRQTTVKEFKVVALRECPLPEDMQVVETPETAAAYWRHTIATNPYFKKEKADYIAQCSG